MSHGDCFKRTGPVARRGLDHKINRSIEVSQQSFALILACFLDYFHERGYCRTIGVVRLANSNYHSAALQLPLAYNPVSHN